MEVTLQTVTPNAEHVIENNGTIEELIEQVRTILQSQKIIQK